MRRYTSRVCCVSRARGRAAAPSVFGGGGGAPRTSDISPQRRAPRPAPKALTAPGLRAEVSFQCIFSQVGAHFDFFRVGRLPAQHFLPARARRRHASHPLALPSAHVL